MPLGICPTKSDFGPVARLGIHLPEWRICSKLSIQSKSGNAEIVIIPSLPLIVDANSDYVKELDLSSLTAIFGNSEEDSPDNEKLLHLYWNRNELKKEFAGMRKEQFRLQDKMRQQEGVSARLQQKIDHLEGLLIDPEWARSVLVFFQLRSVALRCEKKLAKFAEQLKQQREQKQNRLRLDGWNELRADEARPLKENMLDLRNNVQQFQDQAQAEQLKLDSLTGFFSLFKRRPVATILENLAEQIRSEEAEENRIRTQLAEIETRTPPDAEGLDTQAKRSINCMIIAYAQQLYIQFGDDELVGLIKEASEKSVGSVTYGIEAECEAILERIRQSIKAMDSDTDFADVMQKRAKLIADKALFNRDDDAVPVAGTVRTLFKIDKNGLIRESDANLLGENYWRIAKIFSR